MASRGRSSWRALIWAAGFNLLTVGEPERAGAGEFHIVFEEACEGLTWTLEGGSFLKDGRLLESVNLPSQKSVGSRSRVHLLWSGEVNRVDETTGRIVISDRRGSIPVASAHLWTERATGFLYTAAADVTEVVRRSTGPFSLSGLRADPSDAASESGYSHAGWTLLRTDCSVSGASARLRFLAGAEAVPPGEPVDVELWNGNEPVRLVRLGVAGGHGIAGNAGGNLLNGIAVTGKDDWRGASGELWDVSVTAVDQGRKNAWILTFDPLLEWIFPSCAVAEFRLD